MTRRAGEPLPCRFSIVRPARARVCAGSAVKSLAHNHSANETICLAGCQSTAWRTPRRAASSSQSRNLICRVLRNRLFNQNNQEAGCALYMAVRRTFDPHWWPHPCRRLRVRGRRVAPTRGPHALWATICCHLRLSHYNGNRRMLKTDPASPSRLCPPAPRACCWGDA